jgi:hypothetical protein
MKIDLTWTPTDIITAELIVACVILKVLHCDGMVNTALTAIIGFYYLGNSERIRKSLTKSLYTKPPEDKDKPA